jgi:hypothetical protein
MNNPMDKIDTPLNKMRKIDNSLNKINKIHPRNRQNRQNEQRKRCALIHLNKMNNEHPIEQPEGSGTGPVNTTLRVTRLPSVNRTPWDV